MPSNATEDQKLSARANELYWRSKRSVNQIAEEMDLSKSRLYALVRPLPAGRPCPACPWELIFPNRTAREKGLGSCPECGFEGTADERSRSAGKAAAKRKGSKSEEGSAPPADEVTTHPGSRSRSRRALWGSALLGVAAGLYIAIRHRRS